jgi:hypothetical protein
VDAITVVELKEVAEEILTDSGLNLAVTGPIKEEGSSRDSLIKEKPLRKLLKI